MQQMANFFDLQAFSGWEDRAIFILEIYGMDFATLMLLAYARERAAAAAASVVLVARPGQARCCKPADYSDYRIALNQCSMIAHYK